MKSYPIKQVCVYAASSDAVGAVYKDAAHRLGCLMAAAGWDLVYGAGNIGLMGVIGQAIHAGGGRVIGVIPEKLKGLELAWEGADELIVTRDMRERKAIMEERADAFIALPGGFGTLEEIVEVMVLKQLWYHQKPLLFLNVNGVYDKLIAFFDHLIDENFIKPSLRKLYQVASTPEEAIEQLRNYDPEMPTEKWF